MEIRGKMRKGKEGMPDGTMLSPGFEGKSGSISCIIAETLEIRHFSVRKP